MRGRKTKKRWLSVKGREERCVLEVSPTKDSLRRQLVDLSPRSVRGTDKSHGNARGNEKEGGTPLTNPKAGRTRWAAALWEDSPAEKKKEEQKSTGGGRTLHTDPGKLHLLYSSHRKAPVRGKKRRPTP